MSAPRRKLVLAVPDRALRAELAELLGRGGVRVELVERASEDPAVDVVVVRSDELSGGGDLLAHAREEGPGVVVVGPERAVDEARLVAEGASAVLGDDLGPRELGEQLLGLAEAEAEGGLHGPEGGGTHADPKLADFQSRSPRMRDFLAVVRRVAGTESTLLLTGETGVGKERLARAIHAESPRASGPFVAINCGALPESLLESELFGHERGAFTGATAARRGRFEQAEGGTLFLDEIGEMPLHLQVKLLTALQRREVRRLGSEAPRPVDVRIVSASNRDLAGEVEAGRFREDLLYRLNVVALEIPPLRERIEDLPRLAGRFLRHFAELHERREVKGIDEAGMRSMLGYDWPGNVRELVNVVERAVLLCRGDRISRADLPDSIVAEARSAHGAERDPYDESLWSLPLREARRRVAEDFERRYLARALEGTRGAVGAAARRAGIDPRTLYEKMRRYGLRKEDF